MPRHVHPTPFVIQPPDDLVRKQPELRRMAHKLGEKYADRQVVTENDLQIMGGALWNALDLNEAFDLAHKPAGAAILSIIIESGAADVQALPWETLYHPSAGRLRDGAGVPETIAGHLSANRRQSGGGDDAQQYFANLQSAGRLRDGAGVPETIADHQAANRRQGGAMRHAIQYGPYSPAKQTDAGSSQCLGDCISDCQTHESGSGIASPGKPRAAAGLA